ncbi:hypothetical protein BH11PSE3_BH11PSE3_51110 [soil metagenome]
MIQVSGLQELRDNLRVYYPGSFKLLPRVRSTLKIRYGDGRLSSARVVAITDNGDTLEIVEEGRDWFLHKDRQTDYWIVA